MKLPTFQLELITPCFCGGAEPNKQAEIRAPSIRGQLRWWFRTLGGLKSLAANRLSVRQQEDLIFGTTAGDAGQAGRLIVRVNGLGHSKVIRDDEGMDAKPGSDRGYLLFPLRPEKKGKPDERRRDRAVFNSESLGRPKCPTFTLNLWLRGCTEISRDIVALVHGFGHLGSLGFRSRRAMGALAMKDATLTFSQALASFSNANGLEITSLPATDANDAIRKLAQWLKTWRAHGRTDQNSAEQDYPGFARAKSDHDAALGKNNNPGYRAVLGMPMLTKYGNWSAEKPEKPGGTKGRFASPVLLRPHRDAQGRWHALVIFVDAHKWPAGKRVFLKSQERNVSLDLYEAMKTDPRLKPFPG